MSRLYTRTHVDMRDQPVTARANTKASTVFSWGSASNSNKAFTASIRWDKEQLKPTVIIELEAGVAYEVIGPKGNTLSLSR